MVDGFFFPDKNPEGKKNRKIVGQGGRKEDICDNQKKKTIPLCLEQIITSVNQRTYLKVRVEVSTGMRQQGVLGVGLALGEICSRM